MSFSQATASPFWFPDSVCSAPCCVHGRAGGCCCWRHDSHPLLQRRLPTAFRSGMLVEHRRSTTTLKAVIGAALLRRFMHDPMRFLSVRDFGVFCLIAVLAIPAVSAFAGAASRGDWGAEYWANWERWFLGNALAAAHRHAVHFLLGVAAGGTAQSLVGAVDRGPGTAGRARRQPDARIPARLESPGLRRFADVRAGGVPVLGGGAVWHAGRHRGDGDAHLLRRCRDASRQKVRIPAVDDAKPHPDCSSSCCCARRRCISWPYCSSRRRRIQHSLQRERAALSRHGRQRAGDDLDHGRGSGCEFVNKGWLDFTGRALSQERGDGLGARPASR